MQRNWDIIRKILLEAEALPTEDSVLRSTEMADVDAETVACHMRLLLEAGLIVGICRDGMSPSLCHAKRLTWTGHEFLSQIKNASLWWQIKATARDKGLSLSFSVIKDLAKALISSNIV